MSWRTIKQYRGVDTDSGRWDGGVSLDRKARVNLRTYTLSRELYEVKDSSCSSRVEQSHELGMTLACQKNSKLKITAVTKVNGAMMK